MLFMSKAETYYDNLEFRLKFGPFMFVAFLNMLVFHFGVYRRVLRWDYVLPPPFAARAAGALPIGLWMAVIVCGRWIGFTPSVGPRRRPPHRPRLAGRAWRQDLGSAGQQDGVQRAAVYARLCGG